MKRSRGSRAAELPPAFFPPSKVRFVVRELLAARAKTRARRREPVPTRIQDGLAAAGVVVVAVLRNEAVRIPFFLDHYRRLGVQQFLVVDNDSTDGTRELLLAQDDVSLFVASASYKDAHYGNDWINAVLHDHCRGKWVLYVDADEFLVYPGVEDHGLQDLTALLHRRGRRSMRTLMLDMYSDRPPARNAYASGQDPLEVCRLFDAGGYESRLDHGSGVTWTKGGVRARLFFPDVWRNGPALNKTPLIRWTRWSYFLVSAHAVWPASLNGGAEAGAVSGVLLHQRFLDVSAARMTDDGNRRNHTPEYQAYDAVEGDLAMRGPSTTEYRGPGDLVDAGLTSPIDWA